MMSQFLAWVAWVPDSESRRAYVFTTAAKGGLGGARPLVQVSLGQFVFGRTES